MRVKRAATLIFAPTSMKIGLQHPQGKKRAIQPTQLRVPLKP